MQGYHQTLNTSQSSAYDPFAQTTNFAVKFEDAGSQSLSGRRVKGQKKSGHWARAEEYDLRNRIYVPDNLLNIVKIIQVVFLVDLLYFSLMCALPPHAGYHQISEIISTDDRFIFVFYWLSSFIHFAAMIAMFSRFSKKRVIGGLATGVFDMIWHLFNAIVYFILPAQENSANFGIALMYWFQMIFAFILVICNAKILSSLDFRPIPFDAVQKIEDRYLKKIARRKPKQDIQHDEEIEMEQEYNQGQDWESVPT